MMRIGFLTYGLDRNPTGIGRYTVQLLRALVALPSGPEIVVLGADRRDALGIGQIAEYHSLPGCDRLPVLLAVGGILLNRATRAHRLDLIHDPNGIAPFLGLDRRTRRIVTIHDAFPYVCPEDHNWLDNWRYRWLLPGAARNADRVITVSESARCDLVRHLGVPVEKVRVVPEGADVHFQPVDDPLVREEVLSRYGIAGRYLLYVGGINARKNLAGLFEAFARVRVRHPEVRLVVAGKRQWQTEAIDRALDRLKLGESVHFTGYVHDRDLPALYSAAEAFVFPSLYEGFGLPPLEAMACGAPVITSNVSALPEVVGDAALTVDPRDVGAISDAIERVLASPGLRASLRRRGLARAAHFQWERAARETLDIYVEALASSEGADLGVTPLGSAGGK